MVLFLLSVPLSIGSTQSQACWIGGASFYGQHPYIADNSSLAGGRAWDYASFEIDLIGGIPWINGLGADFFLPP
jgi:hypothetical protein